nr:ribonuclease H-like domain, reverse transcriptase, RNA-dependent DNA polymerase [Tanacetum cinerariifolium]
MFDYDDYLSSGSNESLPPSLIYDRYQSGNGYHVVPPPYTGTFMPPKPDLVFNNAPIDVETDHPVFTVKLSLTKPDQDLSHTYRPSAPIIKDWVSDSEDESETKTPQNVPSFVQPNEQVKSPKPSFQHVETSTSPANSKTTILKPKSNGKRRNRKACFVCKSLDHLIKDCDYHEKKMAQTNARNHAPKGAHQHYAKMSLINPQKHVVPTAVVLMLLDQLLMMSPKSRVTAVKALMVNAAKGNPQHTLKDNEVIDSGCSRHMTGNMSYLSDFKELNGGYVAFGGNPKGGKISVKGKIRTEKAGEESDQKYVLFLVWSSSFTNPQNTDGDVAFDEKEPEFDEKKHESKVNVSPCSSAQPKKHDDKTKREAKGKSHVESLIGYRNLSAEFEDYSDNNINEDNSASTLIPAVGKISPNSTNTFSIVGPSNSAASPSHRKSSCIDTSQLPDDTDMPTLEDIPYFDDEDDVGAEADFNNLETSITVTTQTRSMTRVAKDQCGLSQMFNDDFHTCMFACFLSQEEPKRVLQSLKDPSWIEAMHEELLQFKMQKVWVLVDLPNGKRPYGTKWVFRNKKDKRGIMVRKKARLIAQGHTQDEGIDYEEVFALSAFMYETIEEEIYVCQPLGFEDPDYSNKVYKVIKALYGLHQAPRALCETLANYLLENGFQKGKIDQTLFIKRQKDDILLVQIYVDNIIFDRKSASTPIYTKNPLLKDPDGEDVDVHTYRSMIGSLMYLTSSRPDIMFAVCACARFQVTPKASHLHAVKGIFRYLKGKPHLCLWYLKDSPFDLVAYSDSDYVGASLDRKSTTRGCQFLGCILISWQCKKQIVVATSSTEVAYVDAASCCAQVLWIHNQLLDYGPDQKVSGKDSSNPLMADNLPKIVWYSTHHVALMKSWLVQKQTALVNTPRCDEDRLELMELTVFLLPSDEKVGVEVSAVDLQVSTVRLILLIKGFNQIIDFLNESSIKYALTVNPNIYVPCIKQFWTSVIVKNVNDITRLQALVDKKKVIIMEATIREALRLDDVEDVECLPNKEIFAELARMGYEKPSTKLTFYKAFFSSYWKFLIHTILQCRSAKRTSWNVFSSSMASAVICISSGRKFNFLKYIFDSLVRNIDSPTKFYMYPYFLQLMIRKQVGDLSTHTTKYTSPALTQKVFANMRRVDVKAVGVANEGVVSAADDVVPTAVEEPSIPSPTLPTPPPQPSQDVPSTSQVHLTPPQSPQVQPQLPQHQPQPLQDGGIIANIDANEDVNLEDAKDGQDADIDEREASKPAELQEVVDVVTNAKIITEVINAACTTITAADVPIPAATTAAALTLTIAPSRRRKGVDKGKGILVEEPKPLKKQAQIEQDEKYARELEAELNRNIDWDEVIDHVQRKQKEDKSVKRYQALKRKPQSEAQARKNMMVYLKNVVGFKMDYFKGMTYDDIRLIFEKHFDSNMAFLQKIKEQMDEEDSRALKRLNESKQDKAAKKQKLDEEVEELKRHL